MTKRILCAVLGLLVWTAVADAQEEIKVGAHLAYAGGGDIENGSFGYGLQAATRARENLLLEAAYTHFSDEPAADADLDVDTLAATARFGLGGPMAEGGDFYLGGGLNFSSFSVDGRNTGGVDVDDSWGYHGVAGLELELDDRMDMWVDYRYTVAADAEFEFGLLRICFNYRL